MAATSKGVSAVDTNRLVSQISDADADGDLALAAQLLGELNEAAQRVPLSDRQISVLLDLEANGALPGSGRFRKENGGTLIALHGKGLVVAVEHPLTYAGQLTTAGLRRVATLKGD